MNERELKDQELQRFLSGLADRLEIAVDYEMRLRRLGEARFNLFNSTYIGPSENRITEVLRDLLDPAGSHGQGATFLEESLRRVGFDRALKDVVNAHVRTQHFTKKTRPLDANRTGLKGILQ